MKSTAVDFEETPYYKAIQLAEKDKWVAYFRILYNDRDVQHERFTEESRATILKEVGFKGDQIPVCLSGMDTGWNDLLNGFFRHYHSTLYVEYVSALKTYADLVEMQNTTPKDHKEMTLKVENLNNFKAVRQLLANLHRELTNNRGTDLGNIIAGSVIFKGTRVEHNAGVRSKKRLTPREAAEESDYE